MTESLEAFVRFENGKEKKFVFPPLIGFDEQFFSHEFTNLDSPEQINDGIISCGSAGTRLATGEVVYYARVLHLRGDTTKNQTCIDVDPYIRNERTGKVIQQFKNECPFHHIFVDINNIQGFDIGFRLGSEEHSQKVTEEKIKQLLSFT